MPDSPTSSSNGKVYGRYVLHTVNGSALPGVYAEVPNLRLEIVRGVLTLQPNGTFTDSTEVRTTANGTSRSTVDAASGTFVFTSSRVDFSSTRGEHYFMTIGDHSLEQNLGGSILKYRR